MGIDDSWYVDSTNSTAGPVVVDGDGSGWLGGAEHAASISTARVAADR
jgi:hypothetical protein